MCCLQNLSGTLFYKFYAGYNPGRNRWDVAKCPLIWVPQARLFKPTPFRCQVVKTKSGKLQAGLSRGRWRWNIFYPHASQKVCELLLSQLTLSRIVVRKILCFYQVRAITFLIYMYLWSLGMLQAWYFTRTPNGTNSGRNSKITILLWLVKALISRCVSDWVFHHFTWGLFKWVSLCMWFTHMLTWLCLEKVASGHVR